MIVIVVKKEGIKIMKVKMIKIKLMIVMQKEKINIIKMVVTKMKII